MPFTLDNVAVTFDPDEFARQVSSARGFTFHLKPSSMDPILTLTRQRENKADKLLEELNKLNKDKAEKYAKPLKYLIFHYPEIITNIWKVRDPKTGRTFRGWMNSQAEERRRMFFKAPPDACDLIYGSDARKMPIYFQWHLGQCDYFNNAVGIGGGAAYNQYGWGGAGTTDANKTSVRKYVEDRVKNQIPDERTNKKISAEAMNAYSEELLHSRYSPDSVFELSKDELKKDTRHSPKQYKPPTVEQHLLANARFVRGVRRACKSGVAMVATSPLFRNNHAQVFFVLDCLGDLGKVALKKSVTLKEDVEDYVPITSSELTFCFRYWDYKVYQNIHLRDCVRFFVNGNEVMPPWRGNWEQRDANRDIVYSNQEAWLRYKLYRHVLKRDQKPFPGQGEDEDAA